MSISSTTRKLLACPIVLVLCSVSQISYAHTGIADAPTEGERVYTAAVISHGCQDAEKQHKRLGVTAMSILFPNTTDAIATDEDGNAIVLSDFIDGGAVSLSPRAIQNKDVFKKQKTIMDTDDNVRGIRYKNGKLATDAMGYIPFRIQAPTFIDSSCAKSLKVRIAIANYCSKTKKDNRSDIWMGELTNKFDDENVVSTGFWPTMTVKRDLDENPFLVGSNCGEGIDINVQPTPSDIDTYLGIKGYWPK